MSIFDALGIVLPIFFIIALGYFASFYGFLKAEHIEGIRRFVFYAAIPVLLFRTIATTDIPEILPLALWGSYYGGISLIWILVLILSAWLFANRPKSHHITFAFGAGFPNTVLVGIPVILTSFGNEAALPLFLIFVIHGLLLFSATTMALDVLTEKEGLNVSIKKALQHGLKSVLTNSVILALMAGLLYGLFLPPLPALIDKPLELLGAAGIPSALFVMGAMLTTHSMARSTYPAIMMSVMKLIIHPALVYGLGRFVFDLPPLFLAIATLTAAMPIGIFNFILAENYKAAPGAASSAILLSTILSVLTLPFFITALS